MCSEPAPQRRVVRADRNAPVAKARDAREALGPMLLALALLLLAVLFALLAGSPGAQARDNAPAVPSLVTGVATDRSAAASLGGADISTPRAGEAPVSQHDELPALTDVLGR